MSPLKLVAKFDLKRRLLLFILSVLCSFTLYMFCVMLLSQVQLFVIRNCVLFTYIRRGALTGTLFGDEPCRNCVPRLSVHRIQRVLALELRCKVTSKYIQFFYEKILFFLIGKIMRV